MAYRFTPDDDTNFRVQTLLGGVTAGLGDLGEILATVVAVTPGDDASWAQQFTALAQRTESAAADARQRGHHTTAADAYLRAATYFAAAQDGELTGTDDDKLRATFADLRRCWEAFAALHDPPLESVAFPYEDTTLPGYMLSVDGTPRPTVVAINGSDGAVVWLWTLMRAAAARGFNTVVFDGPGQQSMLFNHGVGFRPDWEAVMGPVLDVVAARDDVDADRLVLWGGSQGGYWGARTLAFEDRFAAAILDPGVVDVAASWMGHLPAELVAMLDAGDATSFDAAMGVWLADPAAQATWNFRSRPYRTSSPFEVFTAMRTYNVADVAHQITTPLVLTDPEAEQFWPGQSAELASLVSGPAELMPFTAAEGADGHCEPLARTLVHERTLDRVSELLR